MTVKDVPHDGRWVEFQDPIARYAIAEIYREQGWEPTVVSEQCERTGVWPVLFHRALIKRLTPAGVAQFSHVNELWTIATAIATGSPWHGGYWRTLDISRCDIRRVVEAIEDTPDATITAAYKGDDYAERSAAKTAWLKSLAAVAKERVTFEALDSSRFYSVAVGDETRLFFIDAEDASLATFGATECAIAEDGVTLKGAASSAGTDGLVKVTNGLTGRIVKLLRDPEGTKPVGVKLNTTIALNPGDSFTLTANDLGGADYAVSVEDVPEPNEEESTT